MNADRTFDTRRARGPVIATVALLGAIGAASLLADRSFGAGLLPHGYCFTWIPSLLWLHVISDSLIATAYVSIPITLWVFVRRRTDLPFNWMFLLFALFIVSCGLTHLTTVWNVWWPDYWLSGTVKAFTAAASVMTAAALIPLVPRALALPTVEQLRRANESLEREMARRQAVEAALRAARDELEVRVAQRTGELDEARRVAESERARAEAGRLAAAAESRAKDEFIAMLSHELRNPMAPIATGLAVIGRSTGLDERGRHALTMARRQFAHLRRLVDDLLDAARLARGKIRIAPSRVELQAAATHALETIRPHVEARGQSLAVALPDEPVALLADPVRLAQVIENLLSNASKYTPPGGALALRARRLPDGVEIEVEDDGIGIAPDALERIFEPFAQLGDGQAGSAGGLGIGLALVRHLVQLHGGRVRAQSDGPGRGSRFTVTLPLAD
jgi:signal transduction histidine kinase